LRVVRLRRQSKFCFRCFHFSQRGKPVCIHCGSSLN
jgi:hypothetical protein